jgi:hypothetical protein
MTTPIFNSASTAEDLAMGDQLKLNIDNIELKMTLKMSG